MDCSEGSQLDMIIEQLFFNRNILISQLEEIDTNLGYETYPPRRNELIKLNNEKTTQLNMVNNRLKQTIVLCPELISLIDEYELDTHIKLLQLERESVKQKIGKRFSKKKKVNPY